MEIDAPRFSKSGEKPEYSSPFSLEKPETT